MTLSRRHFLKTCGTAAVGFMALQRAVGNPLAAWAADDSPFGLPVKDPNGMLDLPEGFSYSVLSRTGDRMADGFVVPSLPDGMAAFPADNGLTVLIRNHELMPKNDGPFGSNNELLDKIDKSKLYDVGGELPCNGGTTTVVFDTKTQTVKRQFLSLVGTIRNCAGGATPWNSWISCEEFDARAGDYPRYQLHAEQDHGYVFEVPATTDIKLHDPVPLRAMGRFYHEALCVDPRTGIVYMTEDDGEGLIYRFIPDVPGELHKGGVLQALCLADKPSADTRNWPESKETVEVGKRLPVRWLDLDDVESPNGDLRHRGFNGGACRFSRGEGMIMGDGELYFACTDGGKKKLGQIWRYTPSAEEGRPGEEQSPGYVELFIESHDDTLVENCDNITVAPSGSLVICEDRRGQNRVVVATQEGKLHTLAKNRQPGEFAGSTFSPDGSTLFVNAQVAGVTYAITGPWERV